MLRDESELDVMSPSPHCNRSH